MKINELYKNEIDWILHRQYRDDKTYYLVKWRDLPYDQAIWQAEDSDIPDFQKYIDEYYDLRSVLSLWSLFWCEFVFLFVCLFVVIS